MRNPSETQHSQHVVGVTDAVQRRSSIRAFLPDPVPLELLQDLLVNAQRAPSGGNVQPWQVHALTGEPLAKLVAAVSEKAENEGIRSEPYEYDVYPKDLWEPHSSYKFQCGEDMYATIAVERSDKAGRKAQFARNFQFFGAPVGLFFTLDRRMGPPQWADTGMFMQNIMLLAIERGLDTCAQECWSVFPQTVGRFLNLDPQHILFCGMALGYRDKDAPINTTRTSRAPLDAFVTFNGF